MRSIVAAVLIVVALQPSRDSVARAQESAEQAATVTPCDPPREVSLRLSTSENEERIFQALEKKTDADFYELPLDEAMRYFSETHKIPIVLDRRALENVGIAIDVEITLQVKDISLRSALSLILRELELSYFIENDVLTISTPEVACEYMTIRIYPVCDLVERNVAAGTADYTVLIQLIMRSINPYGWEPEGGEGSIEPGFGTLVILQTEATHNDIGDVLTTLRKVAKLGYRPTGTLGGLQLQAGGGGGFGGGGRGQGGGGF